MMIMILEGIHNNKYEIELCVQRQHAVRGYRPTRFSASQGLGLKLVWLYFSSICGILCFLCECKYTVSNINAIFILTPRIRAQAFSGCTPHWWVFYYAGRIPPIAQTLHNPTTRPRSFYKDEKKKGAITEMVKSWKCHAGNGTVDHSLKKSMYSVTATLTRAPVVMLRHCVVSYFNT